MATEFEKAFEKMSPAERKRTTNAISGMMGMPKKRKSTTTAKKKKKK